MGSVNWENLKILIIDDETFMLRLLERIVRDLGVPVSNISKASNGADALDQLKRNSIEPDVILCDLNMPVMNGLSFTTELRAHKKPELQNIPVLIVTGHSDANLVAAAVKTGINGYVVKPVSVDALSKRLVHVLGM